MVFDRTAAIVAQSQSEFPQYYPHPGWHEHDADEIQAVSEACIAEACKSLEEAGWKKESIKVIGECWCLRRVFGASGRIGGDCDCDAVQVFLRYDCE